MVFITIQLPRAQHFLLKSISTSKSKLLSQVHFQQRQFYMDEEKHVTPTRDFCHSKKRHFQFQVSKSSATRGVSEAYEQ